jgi:hypothetical protein
MERSFGWIKTLKTVTFRKYVENGTVRLPSTIHPGAFEQSGSQDHPIVFNFPWSEEQHYAKYSSSPAFGASYYELNFDCEDVN